MNQEDKAQRRDLKAAKTEYKKAARDSRDEANAGLLGRLDARIIPDAAPQAESWVKGGAKHAWYIPNVNTYPVEQRLFDHDVDRLIRESVLPGHLPSTPLLDPEQSVLTLGSCFARELRLVLSQSGVNSTRFWIPSGLNNTFAIRDFFSWCITGEQTSGGYRYERTDDGAIREWAPGIERDAYVKAFIEAGAFVFTVGLAEVWQDRDTGKVFWRGIPEEIFNAERHLFRLTTVEENAENLRQVVALIRDVNRDAPIVLTLSPVPLLASYRTISCLTADCVSKSVLRVALDQVMSDQPAGVYYWPSFEIVKWVGANLPWSAYGEGGKARDVNRVLVTKIIDAFLAAYYTPDAVASMRERRREQLAMSPDQP